MFGLKFSCLLPSLCQQHWLRLTAKRSTSGSMSCPAPRHGRMHCWSWARSVSLFLTLPRCCGTRLAQSQHSFRWVGLAASLFRGASPAHCRACVSMGRVWGGTGGVSYCHCWEYDVCWIVWWGQQMWEAHLPLIITSKVMCAESVIFLIRQLA